MNWFSHPDGENWNMLYILSKKLKQSVHLAEENGNI